MIARWHALVDWLLSEEDATALALFRLAVGLVVLWDIGSMVTSGALELLWLDVADGGMRPISADGLLAGLVAPTAGSVWAVTVAAMAAAVGLAAGLASRLSAAVLLVTFLWLMSLAPAGGGGHERMISNALFLLVFARADVTLSLRCFLQNRRWTDTVLISGWPRRLLVYQLVIMYVATGVQKLGVDWWPWGDFLALHHVLLMPQWARGDWWWVAWLSPLTKAGTAVTLVWEATWWVVLWWMWLRLTEARGGRLRGLAARFDVRRLYALIGVVMHTALWLLMVLGPFSPITLAYYICLFRGEEWRSMLARSSRVSRRES